jgi:hypothetical protein
MRVPLPDEQLLAAGAERARGRLDQRGVAGEAGVVRQRARPRGRAGVEPLVARLAAVQVILARPLRPHGRVGTGRRAGAR